MALDSMRQREILIAGLGSVGRRHLTNLRALGWTRCRVYRSQFSRPLDAEWADVPVDDDLEAALAHRPLAVIVSNPSALHIPVALEAARAGAHLLIEKPLSHTLERVTELQRRVGARDLTVLMGFQFRFNPGLRQIKAWIDGGAIGTVVSAQVHWGEYLPGMHPSENYRLGYAAREELGGGALLTFCHPFDYLRWLVGEVEHVVAFEARHRLFGLSVDSCVDVHLAFTNGATGHVHLDFVQRPHDHRVTIIGTDGTLTWTHDDHAARRFSCASNRWDVVPAPRGFERSWMFLEEMRHFLACLGGRERPSCTLDDGMRALAIALDAKRSLTGAARMPRLA
jgi:predicted dehydrogenase